MSARQHHCKRTAITLALALLCCVPAKPQFANDQAAQLYVVAGTPTPHAPYSFPVSLYRVSKNKTLDPIREVVRQADGLQVMREWGDTIFAVHLHARPTTISVIHTDDPYRPDNVLLAGSVHPYAALTVMAEAKEGVITLLLPWISDSTDPAHPRWEVASVLSDVAQSTLRVNLGARNEYSELRYEGGTGGPEIVAPPPCIFAGGNIAFNVGQPVVVGSLPPALQTTRDKSYGAILAASKDYLLLSNRSNVTLGKLQASENVFLHDRIQRRWGTIPLEGNWSQVRIFGSWLATIVRFANSEHKEGPGRQSERSTQSDSLPDVRQEYENWAGKFYWMPGILTLQNLDDGRKIRIETGQEDSEILRVDGNDVLYRVNDTIYRARIGGSQLKDTTVVVKDEDVPEIHWAFWSK